MFMKMTAEADVETDKQVAAALLQSKGLVIPTVSVDDLCADESSSLHSNSNSNLNAAKHLEAVQSIMCYVREFLAKPNPNLGRKGPTCPFVPKCLQLDSIFLSVLTKAEVGSNAQLDTLLLNAMDTFKLLEPRSGPKATYKALIFILPELEVSEIPAMIDGTQKRLKSTFVEQGLMLGEFHLRNNATGLHNSSFYPLRTPYPCLVIRQMAPSDIVFLNPVEFPAPTREKMLRSFLNQFGDKSANDAQTTVAKKLLSEIEELKLAS
jgi:hypothetical protein